MGRGNMGMLSVTPAETCAVLGVDQDENACRETGPSVPGARGRVPIVIRTREKPAERGRDLRVGPLIREGGQESKRKTRIPKVTEFYEESNMATMNIKILKTVKKVRDVRSPNERFEPVNEEA